MENNVRAGKNGGSCDGTRGHCIMAMPFPAPPNTSSGVFTPSQWMELQRQALIYKHMAAAMPIPSYLLFSIAPYYNIIPNYAGGGVRSLNLGMLLQSLQQSGTRRCRRTDGKKWRCARDAAPDQKYCERHMHRGGRPRRSRKPVEKPHNAISSSDLSATESSDPPPMVSNETFNTRDGLLDFSTGARGTFGWINGNSGEPIRLPEQRENKLSLDYSTIADQLHCSPFLDSSPKAIHEIAAVDQITASRHPIDACADFALSAPSLSPGGPLGEALGSCFGAASYRGLHQHGLVASWLRGGQEATRSSTNRAV